MPLRNTSPDFDPRERFVLYRLCDCSTCEGKGKAWPTATGEFGPVSVPLHQSDFVRCPDCRGEGRQRQEVATCETPEAVGVAIVTLGREDEWAECPFGLLERGAGKDGAGHWIILPWLPSPRNVTDAARTLAKSKKRAPTS
jgi:hypothetical protein